MFDVCIIGGGVVGCAILNKLTRLGLSCVLVEIQNDVGFGASKANTALIHSGIDCKPGTLKARLNVRGNALFPSILKRLGVAYVQTGHMIVGNDKEKLLNLLERAQKNGVPGVKFLSEKALRKLEPNLNEEIKMGILVPTGGIVESYNLALAFAEEAIINGARVELEFDTKTITKKEEYFVIESKDNRKLYAKQIVNAAAMGFNYINNLVGAETYDTEFRSGEYFILDHTCSGFVSHPVFPLPTEVSKGILVAPTIHGNVLVGPTSILCDGTIKTTAEGLNKIKQDAEKTFKNIPYRENIRVFSGVRTIVGDDFIIEKSKLVDGLINVAGICSPGLSSSPAIAEMVADLLGYGKVVEIKGLKERETPVNLNRLSLKVQNEIIKKNPDYGKIVCRCENISLGEIRDCLNSPLPARSVDAVKRRTRAGMGRCQSGFCIFSVMEELAAVSGKKFDEALKDGVNSKIIVSEIKPIKGK